jgi:type I restriction enzyme S subunit
MMKYDTYKDSSVEWLGEIPKHWSNLRIKDITHKIGSGVTPKGGSSVYVDKGVIFLRSQNVYDDGLRLSGSISY